MAVVVQYEFNNKLQWQNAAYPMLEDLNLEIVHLPTETKYNVEVLYYDLDEIPDNGLLSAKAVVPVPHQFIGYPNVNDFELPINNNKNQKTKKK